ncbi:MAG: GMC family oxidoreductase, partial [Bacteroidota bacterium]
PELLGPAFQASTDAVSRAIGVNTDESFHNAQNKALWDGAKKLGYHVAEIPKNTRGCTPDDASWYGFGGFGDASGTKQSTLKTYLRTAASHGARIMPDTTVETVIVSRGRAIGVEATQRDEEGNAFMVTIQARRVVVAAGALHTPALLMRSGVTHPHLGRHLYLHPTVSVAAFYPRPMDPWHGNMMTAVSNEFAKLDDGFGAKLETPPVHPGLLALALPWKSGEQHKELMLRARNLGAFIVLTRDRHGGRITTSRSGRPKVEYVLNPYDRKHLLAGIAGAARVHVASGAEEILFPHNQLPVYRTSDGEAELERMIAEMPKWGWKPNQVPLFSAHQMGTCRMGGTDAGHPVRPDGQVRGVRGLYVADASLFPEASGVNPMLTIMALAHYVAQGLKHTLPSGDGAAGRSDIEIKHPTSGIRTKDEG